jgi:NAD(P)-dependent dehydrogenase (short-subunit alcohol dehydrogenase family)
MRPQTALITGATSGIGRALALELASRGARVAVAARRVESLENVAREVTARGSYAIPIALDVKDPSAVGDAVRRAERELGSLDMVIANAGVGGSKHATTLKWDDVAEILDVNVRGAIATLLAAVPIMLAQQKGHLVGVSSLAGRGGLPSSGAYSASKAALSTFLETLRVDLKSAGIRVSDVRPGFVATPLTENNPHKMPFLWPVEKAARVIVDRLERDRPTIAFPWPLVALTNLGRALPPWLYDRVVRLAYSR